MPQIDTDGIADIFYALGIILIEIRATESLAKARILSDIFYNVPAKIRNGGTADEIKAEIYEKAAHHGCTEWIFKLMKNAEENTGRCKQDTSPTEPR
jgi:hypothetical protein